MRCTILIAFLLSFYVSCTLGESDSNEQKNNSSDDSPVDDLTVFALADAYSSANGDSNGPKASDIKLAARWMNSARGSREDSSEVVGFEGSDDSDEPEEADKTVDIVDFEDQTTEERKEFTTSASEGKFEMQPNSTTSQEHASAVDSLAKNPSVLELLKEQIYNDFRPFIIIIGLITPAPVKLWLSVQSRSLLQQLRLIAQGALAPLLSSAAKILVFSGELLISLGHSLLQLRGQESPAAVAADPEEAVPLDNSIETVMASTTEREDLEIESREEDAAVEKADEEKVEEPPVEEEVSSDEYADDLEVEL